MPWAGKMKNWQKYPADITDELASGRLSRHANSHSSQGPAPIRSTSYCSFVQSITVDGIMPPGPPSITMSAMSLKFSYIWSGSVYSSTISPGSEADKMGWRAFTISLAILLSGMRRPIVFFLLLRILGTSLLAGKIKV